MLVATRLRHIAGTRWSERRHLKVERLDEPAGVAAVALQEALSSAQADSLRSSPWATVGGYLNNARKILNATEEIELKLI